jgi:hypothetical protein
MTQEVLDDLLSVSFVSGRTLSYTGETLSVSFAIVTDAKKTMIILFEETNLFINFRATSSGSNCSNNISTKPG